MSEIFSHRFYWTKNINVTAIFVTVVKFLFPHIMKTIIHLILFLFLSGQIPAQEKWHFNDEYSENKVPVLFLAKALKTQLEPTFTGLFQKDFNEIEQPVKWQNIYDDNDFGIHMALVYSLKKQLQLKTKYLFGILNFNKRGFGQAMGYNIQISLCYTL